MMISYLLIRFSGQPISNYNIPDLFYLVGLTFVSAWLQIQDFINSVAKENVVAALHTFLKAEAPQELQHSGKRNIRVSVASQNLLEKFVRSRHDLG